MTKRILIMASDGFEQDELFVPLEVLRGQGCEVAVAAPSLSPIQATVLDHPGRTIRPDLMIGQARAEEWDALLIPGGLINPDHLRTRQDAVALVRAFAETGKVLGAICHGPWLLVEANLLRGRRATGWRSIRTDLRNAGAQVVDEAVVSDGTIVTAVGPRDAAAFALALLQATDR
ncbi:type 1 glutamine amidotransferase [Sphingomonas sp. BN140010]|uniref:Type 1 glutamine amidotransferase n=1 Tax=Sphingomonas arvum TaxID=2992113 RepID=A0ABT3JI27_9SPHN|nr:type 1 glutamine amidotransferase domain-containing protein [Sphingomonas sp. BN140010]MCW3798743.1 type 1 glutamine amidotransferase [Sphingomonas sp. BN140010]